MTIIELESELEQMGVPSNFYSIMIGGLPNEKLCIVREDKWKVYYSERGSKNGLKTFETIMAQLSRQKSKIFIMNRYAWL